MIKSKHELEITSGPIFFKLFRYAVPIIISSLLQILYSLADNFVIAKFSSDANAVASIGSTTTFYYFLINIIIGISVGANVIIARAIGEKDAEKTSRSAHTAMLFSVLLGLAFMLIGLVSTRPMLTLIGTQEKLIAGASLYLYIVFLGVPAMSITNCCDALLRSSGDTKTSLYISMASGALNLVLNILFVTAFNMSIAGVALATLIAQYVSAGLLFYIVSTRESSFKISFKKLKIDGRALGGIIRFGLPNAMQNAIFSFTNLILMSGINSLNSAATVYANTITTSVDAITLNIMNSFATAALTFTAQNYGARNIQRIKKTLFYALFWAVTSGIVIGQLSLLFGENLANLYIGADNPERELIISIAMDMMKLLLSTYFICGFMNIFSSTLRGLGYATYSMLVTVVFTVLPRVLWVAFFFPMDKFHSPEGLMIAYPVSWIIVSAIFGISLLVVWKKVKQRLTPKSIENQV